MHHKHGLVYWLSSCIECCRALYLTAGKNRQAQQQMLEHIASIPGSPAADGAKKRLAEMKNG